MSLRTLAPWLAKQMAMLYPDKMKDGDCDYNGTEISQFPSWYLKAQGIAFTPSFSRAARVCEANDDWSWLPYNIMAKHPGGSKLTLP